MADLPLKQFFDVEYSWNSVYQHFARWSKNGSWEKIKQKLFEKYKILLDMSQLDGFHTLSKRGGQSVGYQERKKRRQAICFLFVIIMDFH
ncbi:hypothetical protein REB14_00315 [Chryseobacterium sp. ES2]|uniref:Transposase n=1 Tax=Chryseobacterium metallicongregator TaxID=3073042 RepID=A0ABU1DYK6_9FLAO|nr:hypothetical protein [Chryseobacterium sp. ES2]MDR4950619.1 hypothetical protein [Chryseobacterium sp. ES2]